MNNNQLLVEYYIREVLKSKKTNKLMVEQILLLESGYINEGLYDKIKSLGKYSKTTALILTMLISSGISAANAKANTGDIVKAMNNAGHDVTASQVKKAVSDGDTILNIVASKKIKNGKEFTQLDGLGHKVTGSGGPKSSSLKKISDRETTENRIIKEIDRDIKELSAEKTIKSIHYAYKVIVTKAKYNVNLSDSAIKKINKISNLDAVTQGEIDQFSQKYQKFSKWVNSDDPNFVTFDYLSSAIALFEVCQVMKKDCVKTLKNLDKGSNYKTKLTSKEASVSDISGKKYSKGSQTHKTLQQDYNPYFEFFMITRNNIRETLHSDIKSGNNKRKRSKLFQKIFNHCIDDNGSPSIENINKITNFSKSMKNKYKNYEMGLTNLGDNYSIESATGVGSGDAKDKESIGKLTNKAGKGFASYQSKKLKNK